MGPKGLFYKIDTILDKVPNFKKWADTYPEFYKIMKATDDHIYAFPKINNFPLFDWGLCIRADLLDNEAITADKIDTLDDLYNALKIIKDKTGNAPWVARAEKVNENKFLPAATQIFGTGVNMYYNGKEDTYKFGPLDENFRVMVEYLNKCYKDGLINKDAFVMDDDTYSQLLKGDKADFFIDNMNSIHWVGPDNSRFEVILPPKVKEGNKEKYNVMVLETVLGETVNADVIVLAQGSIICFWTQFKNYKDIKNIYKQFSVG